MATEPLHARDFPAHARDSQTGSSTVIDRWLLARVQQLVRGAQIRFVLWDGFESPPPPTGPAVASIAFRNRAALVAWIRDPELNFGETYISGDVSIRGDLVELLEAIYRAYGVTRRDRFGWSRANDRHAARDNVHRHYDLGNDFYRLWLDREMLYTCAYFPSPDATLEEAQIAKMELVCRKLRLQPGERVIEAGCGWGSLALFMAGRYGVTVRAFNVSREQIAFARRRAAAEGLAARVEFIDDDYRQAEGECDAFVSVGMLEHVGRRDYPTFGRVMNRTLTAQGRGLLHFIGRNQPAPLNAWIRKRIFPGAYAPALDEVVEGVLRPSAFSVLDVENLRLHYAKTVSVWLERFERAADQVSAMFDERFVRAWRLYLAGSEAAFSTGTMQLFQVVFARECSNAIPWTRADDSGFSRHGAM